MVAREQLFGECIDLFDLRVRWRWPQIEILFAIAVPPHLLIRTLGVVGTAIGTFGRVELG